MYFKGIYENFIIWIPCSFISIACFFSCQLCLVLLYAWFFCLCFCFFEILTLKKYSKALDYVVFFQEDSLLLRQSSRQGMLAISYNFNLSGNWRASKLGSSLLEGCFFSVRLTYRFSPWIGMLTNRNVVLKQPSLPKLEAESPWKGRTKYEIWFVKDEVC